MMRPLILPLVLLFCLHASGQNWALLNPAYKYNYCNDGSDTISNQIFVTHTDTLGPDSFRYELNRIGAICPGCSPDYSPTCWFGGETDMIRSTTAQVWGRQAIRSGASWLLVGATDTLLVRPTEPIGSMWTGTGGVTGTIYSINVAGVLGVLDSLKWTAFSNGDTLAISRDHGIVYSDRSNMGAHELVGVDGATEEGQHFPRVIELFNYQVGDVLQYHDESSFQSSFCVHFVDGRSKYEVLARVDGIAVTTYTLERTFSSVEESYYPQWWTPCGTYHHEGQEQITLTVHHDRFTEENLFSSRILGPLYPSMITGFSSLDPFSGLPTRIQTRLDELGRHVVEPYVVNDDGSGATVLCTSMEDSMLFFPDQNIRHQFSFTEQIGLTYSDFYYFEGGATRNLEGYRLDGEEWGTVWSNSMILGSLETYAEQARLVPNPADDHLGMLNVSPGTTFSIIDVQGRLLRQHQITEANEHIDVRALPPGVYLLRMEGSRPQRFVISR